MKQLILVLLCLILAFVAYYLPKNSVGALLGKVGALAIIVYFIMQLMQKIPSKNQKEDDEV